MTRNYMYVVSATVGRDAARVITGIFTGAKAQEYAADWATIYDNGLVTRVFSPKAKNRLTTGTVLPRCYAQ